MPDANGNIKGISLSGVSNPWLDSLERKAYAGPISIPAEQLVTFEINLVRDLPEARRHYPDAPATLTS